MSGATRRASGLGVLSRALGYFRRSRHPRGHRGRRAAPNPCCGNLSDRARAGPPGASGWALAGWPAALRRPAPRCPRAATPSPPGTVSREPRWCDGAGACRERACRAAMAPGFRADGRRRGRRPHLRHHRRCWGTESCLPPTPCFGLTARADSRLGDASWAARLPPLSRGSVHPGQPAPSVSRQPRLPSSRRPLIAF